MFLQRYQLDNALSLSRIVGNYNTINYLLWSALFLTKCHACTNLEENYLMAFNDIKTYLKVEITYKLFCVSDSLHIYRLKIFILM
jgi:hypothetical protein